MAIVTFASPTLHRDVPELAKDYDEMRDLAIKSRVLGDGYYYIPIDLWPKAKEPVTVHKHDWTVISSIPRTTRTPKKRRVAVE